MGRSRSVIVARIVRGRVICVVDRRHGVVELFVFGEIVRVIA